MQILLLLNMKQRKKQTKPLTLYMGQILKGSVLPLNLQNNLVENTGTLHPLTVVVDTVGAGVVDVQDHAVTDAGVLQVTDAGVLQVTGEGVQDRGVTDEDVLQVSDAEGHQEAEAKKETIESVLKIWRNKRVGKI